MVCYLLERNVSTHSHCQLNNKSNRNRRRGLLKSKFFSTLCDTTLSIDYFSRSQDIEEKTQQLLVWIHKILNIKSNVTTVQACCWKTIFLPKIRTVPPNQNPTESKKVISEITLTNTAFCWVFQKQNKWSISNSDSSIELCNPCEKKKKITNGQRETDKHNRLYCLNWQCPPSSVYHRHKELWG